jgi:hypothetical protein
MAAFVMPTSYVNVFEAVVCACMDAGLVKGKGFAVDASVMEASASRYRGKAPDEIDRSLPERQTRAVAEFLAAFEDEDPEADRKLPAKRLIVQLMSCRPILMRGSAITTRRAPIRAAGASARPR